MTKNASIDKPARALKAALRSRSRKAFFPFLEEVYDQYDGWRMDRHALASSSKLAAEYNLALRSDSHAVRILIEACCQRAERPIDEKTLSEWTMCIRKAWRRRDKWRSFSNFLTHNGGISGVAALPPRLPRYKRSDR
jgi:hypothetical protein